MKVPRYLGVSDIVGMGWCDQQFIFRARKNEDMFKSQVEMLRKQPDNMEKFEARKLEFVHVVPIRKMDEFPELSLLGIPDDLFSKSFGEFIEPVKMMNVEAFAFA